MADDVARRQDDEGARHQYEGEEPHDPQREPEQASHPYEREPQSEEEWRERLSEAEERIEEMSEEEKRRSEIFSKKQIIEEMAVGARGLYGENNHHISEDDYFDLVDVWLMLPAYMEEKYHKKFRRRVGIRRWDSRKNVHLIPRKYVLAMKGINKAIREEMLYPLWTDKARYAMAVKFPPIGPPLAYYDRIGPDRDEAAKWGRAESRGGMSEEEVQETSQVESIKENLRFMQQKKKRLEKKMEMAKERMKDAPDGSETEQKAKRMLEWYGQQYRELRSDFKAETERLQDVAGGS